MAYGPEWERVHMRIAVVLESDVFKIRLFGPKKKELLTVTASHVMAKAHDVFYKDLLAYVEKNLWSVDRSGVSNHAMPYLEDNLFALSALCKTAPTPLPDEVVAQLFEGIDADEAEREQEREALDRDAERMRKERKELIKKRRGVEEDMARLKRQRAALDGGYLSPWESDASDSGDA